MTADGPIVWLASYPKSGNTWLRAFLTAYLDPDAPLDLNALAGGPVAQDRRAFDHHVGVASSDLSEAEVDDLRRMFHLSLARDLAAPWFIKVHHAFGLDRRGAALFPAAASRAAICLVRDPLDIAVSFAHHRAASIDDTIAFMADPAAAHDAWPDRISPLLPERLGRWGEHVTGWLEQSELPVTLLRYEDMLAEPEAAFGRALAAAGIAADPATLGRAVARCGFATLRSLEQAAGFGERPRAGAAFFRAGESGGWRTRLSRGHVERIVATHGAVMGRLGYLDDALAFIAAA